MFCQQCGNEYRGTPNFCVKCGAVINDKKAIRTPKLSEKIQSKFKSASENRTKQESTSDRVESPIQLTQNQTQVIPWSRFFARTIDVGLTILVYTNLLLSPTAIATRENLFLVYFVSIALLNFTIEPVLIAVFGTTPGKALYGIKILNSNYSNLSVKTSFLRSIQVYFFGMFMGLGFLSTISNIICFFDYRKESITNWDKTMGSIVISEISSSRRGLTHLVCIVMPLIGLIS